MVMASTTSISASRGTMPLHISVPEGDGPWPAVVVVSDALGMTSDLGQQSAWLASEGFLAVAPDLFYWGGRLRCLFATMRQALAREGDVFDDLETVRRYALDRGDTTDAVAVVGFCLGGGIALLLAATGDYDASSVNYGDVPRDALELLEGSCPVVGSYGARDVTLKKAPGRLSGALEQLGIEHDVVTYEGAGHAFMNDHDDADVPKWAVVMGRLSASEYHEASAIDARRRIAAFFDLHLRRRSTDNTAV